MKEKLVKFGNKAFDFVTEVFDNETLVYVVSMTAAAGCISYVYRRGFKDACNNISALIETSKEIESK